MSKKNADKKGYNEFYRTYETKNDTVNNNKDYIEKFESAVIAPFFKGGGTKGYVRYLSVAKLIEDQECKGKKRGDVKILDAGSGVGKLSVYLACLGFNVTGVDISEEGCYHARRLAKKMGVESNCNFIPASLGDTDIEEKSIDYIIGHAALHHFIKYKNVSKEFFRIMKKDGIGFFADSFGENMIYHIFHNKKRMKRLGDTILTKKRIFNFFNPYFRVKLLPADWFTMLDKLFLKILSPRKISNRIRSISKLTFSADRKVPNNRATLFLSGSVLTIIRPKNEN